MNSKISAYVFAMSYIFVHSFPSHPLLLLHHSRTQLLLSENEYSNQAEEEDIIVKSTVKIDDGGSNLTDRFKYKVNALMGVFDPKNGEGNDERQEGNILNAMVTFPTRYTFNIVGKTYGDDSIRDTYVEEITRIILGTSGDEESECKITPRGKNFTKIQFEVEVQNASMVNAIYEDISKLERTAMRF